MTSRTHNTMAFAGLLTAAILFPPASLNFLTLFSSLVGNMVGSYSPDTDQASNRLWDLLPGGDYIGRIFRPFFLGHRSLSHSLLGTWLYYQLLEWLLPKILNPEFVDVQIIQASILIGFVIHLLGDSFTEEGIPLFFPIQWKIGIPPISSWRIKTGKWFENLIVFPVTVGFIIWLAITYREHLVSVIRLIQN